MLIETKRLKIFIEQDSLVVLAGDTIIYNVKVNEVTRLIYPSYASILFHIFTNDLNLLRVFCEDITNEIEIIGVAQDERDTQPSKPDSP
jgi:hypothetical protein